MDHQAWRDAQTRKRSELIAALNIDALKKKTKNQDELSILLSIENLAQFESFDVFEASLESICTRYTQRSASKILMDKLYPWFDHIKSFTGAISASTQINGYASLCWGALLIVIQCSCMFAESLHLIMEQLGDLYEEMPLFSEHLALYPSHARLRFALRDVYEDFLDYYIHIVKCLRRSPLVNLVRMLVSPSLKRELGGIRTRLAKHIENFHIKASLAHRQQVESNHLKTMATLNTLNSHNEPHTPEFPLFTVNLRRNPTFTGRETALVMLHSSITGGKPKGEPRSCTIYGIGGVGKTQTALEYSYRYRPHYECIFWLRAEKPIELLNSYAAIGRKLGITSGNDVGAPAVESIQEWLEETDRNKLLVFDNVKNWDSISTYWPMSSKGRTSIIVTAQKEVGWTDDKLSLEPLTSDRGSSLLLKQLGMEDAGTAKGLAEEISQSVGGLPLWLSQVGGFIQFSKCTLSDYRDSHHLSSNMLGGEKTGDNWRYERAISSVFDDAIQQLPDDAAELLYILTFLNPEETDEAMLLSDHVSEELAFLCKNNKPRYLCMVKDLSISQLVHRETSGDRAYLTTHRSLQEGLMHKLNKDTATRQKAFERAALLLREVFPSSSKLQQAEVDKWPLIRLVLPHLLSLTSSFTRAEPNIQGSLLFAELLVDVGGMNLFDRGFVRDAQTLLRAAESTLDQLHCPKFSRIRGDILIVLGLTTDHVGITERLQGLNTRLRAKEVRQKCFSEIPADKVTIDDEILLYNSFTDLACSYQQLNRFDEVEEYCEDCLEKYKTWGQEEEYPYEYAKYHHHMAFVYVYRKETAKAVKSGRRAADLMALAVPGAQTVTIYRFDWAVFLFQNGETERAIEEHQKIVNERVKECGNLNLLTIQSRLMLGIMYFCKNELDEAEDWLRQTLTLDHRVHWPRENVARAKYYLSQVLLLKEGGKTKKGASLEHEARSMLEELLTPVRGEDAVAQELESNKSRTSDGILFDYLVPWGYRIVVPQASGTARAFT